MILEGPSDKPHTVRKKRRGKRVAGKAVESPPVEREAEWRRAIDKPAIKPVDLRHGRPFPAACRAASSTFRISWLTVSRVTISQLRSPIS